MAACNNNSARSVFGPKYGIVFQSDEELANVALFSCYSEALLQFATACCVIFMLIGIPGNLTTIVALARCKKVRNATAIFIINLHTSDLIFNCFIMPVTAMTFAGRHWTHGWVMCKLYAFFKFALSSSSLSTVVAISINRYVIVCHPLLYPRLYNKKTISIIILIIWTAAFAMFTAQNFGAWGRFDLEPNGGFCTMLPDLTGSSPKKFFIAAFVVPYLTITFCYARILWVFKAAKKNQRKHVQDTRLSQLPIPQSHLEVATYGNTLISSDPLGPESSSTTECNQTDAATTSDTSTPQSPREANGIQKHFKAPFRLTRKLIRQKVPTSRDKRLCAMIAAIMLSNCISHLPVMVLRLAYKEFESEPVWNVFSHLMLFSGTCMNPIIYVLMSREYRQAYKSLLDAIIKKFQALKSRT